jgi:hypothetical protein
VDRSLDFCLGVLHFALVLNAMRGMLGWLEWRWLGVFIALNHQTTVGEGLLSMGAPDTVRCASHVTQPLGFGCSRLLEPLSSSGTGQSGAAPDRYYSLSGAPLATALSAAHCLCTVALFL